MNHEPKNILLAVDIGNSTIGFGLFSEPEKNTRPFIAKTPVRPRRPHRSIRTAVTELINQEMTRRRGDTETRRKGKAFTVSPRLPFSASGYRLNVIVSSVVPSVDNALMEALGPLSWQTPLIVTAQTDSGLTFETDRPGETGADRIANAVAGYHYAGGPVAVVDFGTATTLTIVGKKLNFLGGAILPGMELMRKSLHAQTARLPLVDLARPEKALGRNTVSAITSGIIFGTAGAVEALVKRMEKELDFKLQLVVTGGCAQVVAPLIRKRHTVIPDLTFQGLRLIHLRNRQAKVKVES